MINHPWASSGSAVLLFTAQRWLPRLRSVLRAGHPAPAPSGLFEPRGAAGCYPRCIQGTGAGRETNGSFCLTFKASSPEGPGSFPAVIADPERDALCWGFVPGKRQLLLPTLSPTPLGHHTTIPLPGLCCWKLALGSSVGKEMTVQCGRSPGHLHSYGPALFTVLMLCWTIICFLLHNSIPILSRRLLQVD